MRQLITLFVFTLLFCVSCSSEQVAEKQLTIPQSKVIYHDRLDPQPLNKIQLTELSEYIEYLDMETKKIWFCRVLYNNGDLFTVDTYFRSIKSSQRITKGKRLRSSFSDLQIALRPFEKLPDYIIDKYFEIPDYVYVSVKNKIASEINDIPSPQSLPFDLPVDFTNQEIVEIVDFVRSSPTIKREYQNDAYILYCPDSVDAQLPIYSIIKNIDGNIEVDTGTQEGPLAGSGQSLTIKKTDGGYELISIAMWVS